jgi:hypothetical protein
MGIRTGIRSGKAPANVWHLHLSGVVRTYCGVANAQASTDRPLQEARKQAESQGATICRRCETIYNKGAMGT